MAKKPRKNVKKLKSLVVSDLYQLPEMLEMSEMVMFINKVLFKDSMATLMVLNYMAHDKEVVWIYNYISRVYEKVQILSAMGKAVSLTDQGQCELEQIRTSLEKLNKQFCDQYTEINKQSGNVLLDLPNLPALELQSFLDYFVKLLELHKLILP
jgi:hypothetical protein